MAEQQQRRLDYRIGLDTDEFRNQLVGMQADVSNTVNQINTAMETSARAVPGRTTNTNRSLYQTGEGGYRYNPGTFEASMASTGLLDAPHGVSQQQYQQKSSEIAAGNLAQGLTNTSSVLGSAATGASIFTVANSSTLWKAGSAAGRGIGALAGGIGAAGAASLGGAGTGALAAGGTYMATGSPTLAAGAGIAGTATGLAGTAALTKAGMKGAGSIGSMIGKGVAGFGLPAVAAYAGQEMVMSGVERVNKYRGMNQTLDRVSANFIPDNASESPGPGFGQEEREDVTEFLMNKERREPVFDTGDIQNMLVTGAETGMFDSVGGSDEFKRKFEKLSEKVKEITKVFRTSLDKAMGTVRELDRMGYGDIQEIEGQMRKLRSRSDSSGTELNSMMKTFQEGSKMAQKTGLEGRAGADIATQVRANIENKVQHGEVDKQTVRQHGGSEAISRQMTARLLRFFQSNIGTTAAGAFAGDDFETVDESKMFQYLRDTDDQTLINKMSENMSENGFAESQRRLMQNRPELISDITESDLAPHLATKIGVESLKNRGVEPSKKNLQTFFRKNMGLNRDMAEEFVDMGTDTKQLRRRAATLERQRAQRRIEKMRDQRWDMITPDADFAMGLVKPYSAGRELVAQSTLDVYQGTKKAIQNNLESGREFINQDILGMPEQINTDLTEVSDEFVFENSQEIWNESSREFAAVNQPDFADDDDTESLATVVNRAGELGRMQESAMFGTPNETGFLNRAWNAEGGRTNPVRETFTRDTSGILGDTLSTGMSGASVGGGIGLVGGALTGLAMGGPSGLVRGATTGLKWGAGIGGTGGAVGEFGQEAYQGGLSGQSGINTSIQAMTAAGTAAVGAGAAYGVGWGAQKAVAPALIKSSQSFGRMSVNLADDTARRATAQRVASLTGTAGRATRNFGNLSRTIGRTAFKTAGKALPAASISYDLYRGYQKEGVKGVGKVAGMGVLGGTTAYALGSNPLGLATLGTAATFATLAQPFIGEENQKQSKAIAGYVTGQGIENTYDMLNMVDPGEFFSEEGWLKNLDEKTGHERGIEWSEWMNAPDEGTREARIENFQGQLIDNPAKAMAQTFFPNTGNKGFADEEQLTEDIFSQNRDMTYQEAVGEVGRRRVRQLEESSQTEKSRGITDLMQTMDESEKRTMARRRLRQETDLSRDDINERIDEMSMGQINRNVRERIEKQTSGEELSDQTVSKRMDDMTFDEIKSAASKQIQREGTTQELAEQQIESKLSDMGKSEQQDIMRKNLSKKSVDEVFSEQEIEDRVQDMSESRVKQFAMESIKSRDEAKSELSQQQIKSYVENADKSEREQLAFETVVNQDAGEVFSGEAVTKKVEEMDDQKIQNIARKKIQQESDLDLSQERIKTKLNNMNKSQIRDKARSFIDDQAVGQNFSSDDVRSDFFREMGQQEIRKRAKTVTALTQDVELSAQREIAQNKIDDETKQKMAEDFNETLRETAGGVSDTGAPDIRKALKSAARVNSDVENPTEGRLRQVAEIIRPKIRGDNPVFKKIKEMEMENGLSRLAGAQSMQNIGQQLQNFDKRKESFKTDLEDIFGENNFSEAQIRGSLSDRSVSKAAQNVIRESGTQYQGLSDEAVQRRLRDQFDVNKGESREAVRMARKFASGSESVDEAINNVQKISKKARGIQKQSARFQVFETVKDIGKDLGLENVQEKEEVVDRLMNASPANEEVKTKQNPMVGDLISARDQIFGKMEKKGIEGITTESLGEITGRDFSSKKEAMSFVKQSDDMGEDLKDYIGTALQSEKDDEMSGRELLKGFMTTKSQGSAEGVQSAASGGGEQADAEMDKLSKEADALQTLAAAVDNLAGQVK